METALAAVVAAANAATAADHAQTKSGTSSTASGTAAKVVTCSGFELSDQARIFVTFSNANTVADAITLNVNGTGAKSVYNQMGIISASNTALFAANQPIEFRYDGTGWVLWDVEKAMPDSSIGGAFSALYGSATGTNANVSYTVGSICVRNSAGSKRELRNVSASAAVTNSGAGGLDINSVAANTWYYVHVIYNPATPATALLLSLSATAPNLPSGYTYWARVGAIKTDGTANKYPLPFVQDGCEVTLMPAAGTNLTALPSVASGLQGTITNAAYSPVSVSLSGQIPSTAKSVEVMGVSPGGVYVAASASTGFGGGTSSNPPTLQNGVSAGYILSVRGRFNLSGQTIYYAGAGSACALQLVGWRDNI